ncbi:DMT family transporter [Acinetobacter sp. ANC 4216]|uniref:DMT family transporter n=1 Tax=unclassified Acinetobacter TaxID=196816 RepID=UPI0010391811|nr:MULTISPECIES: DMT family transporter [unclassified Acinetobacter]MCT8089393.1 DMT family transporter [Acinetobacter sp. F_3_1]MCT8096636.1 DMT family transporter [Acinetobacter sp. C_3_1]MCT8101028.1 DMT family transporter [Acinetobacter sp. C_4_1]MCT8134657.1 DMT family transporter [Acinetobacter sp. T_3_1]TCB70858.1 DMT family transporter [Acinetobacter sp. ANC 4216]
MTQQHKTVWWAFTLPLLAVLIWSMNITVTRYVADYISPVSISFYRWLVAFLVLTPFMLGKVWRERQLVLAHWKQLAVLGAFGMVLYQGLGYSAAHYTTATNMGIINAFIPVFTIFVSMLMLKDIPNRFAVVGSMLSFAGLLYVMAQGNFSQLVQSGGHLGDVMMVLAVFFYAFYGVFLKKWQLQIPLLISLYVQIIFALLYHLPFVLYLGLDAIDQHNVSSVLYAGIFPSLIAPLVWMLAVQIIGPNRTSIFMNLMPVCTAIIAKLWLGEAWTIYHSIGGLVILSGILLAQKKESILKTAKLNT